MVALAFYEAVSAMSANFGSPPPFPKGLVEVELPDWKLTLNNSAEFNQEIPPYSVKAEHKQFLVLALFDAGGGIIGGGMTEDEFITQMRAASGIEAPSGVETGNTDSTVGESPAPEGGDAQ